MQYGGAVAAAGAASITKSGHTVAKTWVMVWGSAPPASSIGFERPTSPADSGFTALFDDAPEPEDVPEENPLAHPGISTWCLQCLLEEHPELGRGLEIAREYGLADLDDGGEWVVGDFGRLKRH